MSDLFEKKKEASGLTYEDIGKKAGIKGGRPTVFRVIKKTGRCRIDTVQKVAKVLDIKEGDALVAWHEDRKDGKYKTSDKT